MAPAPGDIGRHLPQALVPVATLANGHGKGIHARGGPPATSADGSPAPGRGPADRKPAHGKRRSPAAGPLARGQTPTRAPVAGRPDPASTSPGDGGQAPVADALTRAGGGLTGVGAGGTIKSPASLPDVVELPLDTGPLPLPEVRLP